MGLKVESTPCPWSPAEKRDLQNRIVVVATQFREIPELHRTSVAVIRDRWRHADPFHRLAIAIAILHCRGLIDDDTAGHKYARRIYERESARGKGGR